MLPEEKRAYMDRKRKTLYAKRLRRRMTPEEYKLWNALRGRKCHNLKFRRQAPIDHFIVDFLCVQAQLIVEIDGGIHSKQKEYDAERENYLKERGYRILRFSNDQVTQSLTFVLQKIVEVAKTIHVHSYSK